MLAKGRERWPTRQGPSRGILTLNADGSFTYTPRAGFEGTDSFTYRASDGGPGESSAATVNPDTTPPDTDITSGPQGLVNSRSASFGFSSTEANSTFECRLRSLKENAPGVLFSGCLNPRNYPDVAGGPGLEDGPYAFEVRATDTSNNTDQTPARREFTVDATAPTVTSFRPADGAMDVPATTNVEVAFSEAMDPATIKEATFALERLVPNGTGGFDNEPVFGTVAYDVGTKTATLTPEEGLQPGALYQVSVGNVFGAGDVKDLAGNRLAIRTSRFTVADTVAPDTTIVRGPNGPTNDTTPTFTFSGLDNLSASAKLVFSHKVVADGVNPESVDWSQDSGVLSTTLPALSDGKYSFYVRAKDEADNVDQDPARRSFAVDTVKPKVLSVTPRENFTGVARGTNLTATFDEKMKATTLSPGTFKLYKVNPDKTMEQITNVEVTLTTNGLKATLDPFGPNSTTKLGKNTKYKAVITTGARDSAGNPLTASKVWYFTTGSS